ncbi:uncharacterized protein LOC133195336 [Saccostrea echinata]|uniref:uncharacterized protein LOC133195336 n=1 Tax=Saccostrea echinata TaxID=191078 RepID=UPI002A83CF9E|nr:uncharacterized protein LOC133195336 [Saccostrea echinata]
MDFHVIHFDYDNQITAVNSSKVQCKEVLKPGERCTVPFETEDLSEDGRTEYRDVLYEGTVICLNLVKKKAVELANKGQKDLDSGTSLFSIINKLQDQGKKRDSAAKLAEAIESLTEEKPKAKKVKKSDTEDKVKGTEKILGITPREASIASTVLRKIAYLLGDEASTMGPRSINHSPTDSDRMSSFSLETESSPVISKNMGMLIKDPSDPERFRNVIVDKPKERELKLKAAASKKPTYTMLNGLLELVFSRKELSSSSGLGLRKKKENSPKGQVLNGPPLDALKVSAIKEYLRYHCEQNSWTNLTAAEFNMTITNKITNSRRIASKHPSLKVPQIAVKGTSTSAEK